MTVCMNGQMIRRGVRSILIHPDEWQTLARDVLAGLYIVPLIDASRGPDDAQSGNFLLLSQAEMQPAVGCRLKAASAYDFPDRDSSLPVSFCSFCEGTECRTVGVSGSNEPQQHTAKGSRRFIMQHGRPIALVGNHKIAHSIGVQVTHCETPPYPA